MPTFDDLYVSMMCLIGFSFEYIIHALNILIGNLKEIKLNDIFINAFLFIAWLKNCIEVNANYLYDTYPFVRKNTDKVCYAIDYCNAHFNGYRIEPLCDTWISLTTLDKSNTELFLGDKYIYSEQYYYFNSITSISTDDLYKQCLEYVSEIAKSRFSPTTTETMITMKVSDKYLCASFINADNYTTPICTLTPNKGNNYFLSIEYTHPNMSAGIVLDLPTNMYNATSNIFTPAFIKRYLEYQSLPYVFDMRYTLKILDTNVNMFNMRSNQHIKINDRSYDVVTVGTLDEEDVVSDQPDADVEYDADDEDDANDANDADDANDANDADDADDANDADDAEVEDDGNIRPILHLMHCNTFDTDNDKVSENDHLEIDSSPENEDIEKELSEIEEIKPNILENEDILECKLQLTANE